MDMSFLDNPNMFAKGRFDVDDDDLGLD